MRTTTKRRGRQLALVTVAAPVAAWALEQAARRAEAGDKASSTSRRLRQGADFVQRFGRGPLAAGRPAGPATGHRHLDGATTAAGQPAWRLADGSSVGFASSAAATPRGATRPHNPARPRLRRTWSAPWR
jgi:hypothetical protein